MKNLQSKDVHATFSPVWQPSEYRWGRNLQADERNEGNGTRASEVCRKKVGELEKDGRFLAAWMMIDQAERERHLLNGLKGACEKCIYGQDGRAMCPEITLPTMLEGSGRDFIRFLIKYMAGIRNSGDEDVYFLPNEWWEKVIDQPGVDFETFAHNTVQSNIFISM